MHIDPKNLSRAQRYFRMIDVVVPRPIAWVSTLSASGVRNLAPFSFFTGVSSTPPCVMFSIAPKRKGQIKDTLTNILATKEFVVNMVSRSHAKPMVQSSVEYASSEDEFTLCDLETVASSVVTPPRLKQTMAALECSLFSTHEILDDDGRLGGTMVVGRVRSFYLADEAFDHEHKPNTEYAPIARLGGRAYAEIGTRFNLKPEMD